MTTKDLLNLDYREEENKQIIQKALGKIKPLSKYSDEEQIPLEAIEKLIHLICKRYKVWVREITLDPRANSDYDVIRCQLVNEDNLEFLSNVFGMCIYEAFAKMAIFLWSEVKKEKFKRR